MSCLAIKVEDLSKQYQIGAQAGGYRTFREAISGAIRAPINRMRHLSGFSGAQHETFWALRDVSFDVNPGEVVGIIGRNGAGKSTLLKILSQITEPTSGRIELNGRVASLLEVGTGFHPELTGRENIFLNGAILGMSRSEIKRKFDEIAAFAEIDKFLDTPVKYYSSGMYVRLAFAVAAHLEPEILIVDEVLAVGDAGFQKKCLGRMSDVSRQGRTVILVSHNMAIVRKLCSASVLLSQGRRTFFGRSDEAIDRYLTELAPEAVTPVVQTAAHPLRLPRMKSIVKRVSLLKQDGVPTTDFRQGEQIHIQLEYDSTAYEISIAGAGFILETADGVRVGGFNTYMASPPPHALPPKGTYEFIINRPYLAPGKYCLTVAVGSHQGVLEDKIERVLSFDILTHDIYETGYLLTSEDGVVALECTCRTL